MHDTVVLKLKLRHNLLDLDLTIIVCCFFFLGLELGELLHDPTFGLFEAMSAIEMMDSKMDAGMICNKGKRPPILTFDQAVQVNNHQHT